MAKLQRYDRVLSEGCRLVQRRNTSSFIMKEIRAAAAKQQRDVTLRDMFNIGRVQAPSAQSAMFLREELPIRLAKRVIELDNLPYGLSGMPSVQKVHALYVDSFTKLSASARPINDETEQVFQNVIQSMLQRHRDVVPLMAIGIKELKNMLGDEGPRGGNFIDQCPFLQDFLDRFYFSRIGIRVLIAHHLALHESRKGWVGIIQEECSPAVILKDAILNASDACERTLGVAPEVKIRGNIDLVFPYIPEHIHYILFELLKNSMRAVVERARALNIEDAMEPIEAVIADGEDDIVIKVSDCGGGIRRKDMALVWTYAYTTAPTPASLTDPNPQATIGPLLAAPMAGFGYGLPMSRLHARAFKGDLVLIPMDGYGLDAYLYLNKLSSPGASTVPK